MNEMQRGKTELLIPDDVKRYSNRQMAKRYFIVIASLAFVIFALTYYAADFWESIGFWTVPVYIAVFVLTMVWNKSKKLLDRTWVGDITDVKVKTVVKPSGTRAVRYFNVVTLKVHTEDGKDIKYEAYSKNARDYIEFGSFLKRYTVGKKIVHIKGTKYLQIIPAEGRALTCVVCGWYDSDSDDKCDSCKHSLKLVKEDPNAWLWE